MPPYRYIEQCNCIRVHSFATTELTMADEYEEYNYEQDKFTGHGGTLDKNYLFPSPVLLVRFGDLNAILT